MAIPTSLSYASVTIGFISFAITIITLLGVYSSLLSTMRSAPTRIPIVLGNLRQEILAERAYLRQRIAEGRDPFGVMPETLDSSSAGGVSRGAPGHRGGRRGGIRAAEEQESYTKLLSFTVRDLWMEFRRLERPFLVNSGLRAKAIEKGDYWSEGDLVSIGRRRTRDVEGGDGSEYSTPSGDDEKGGARRRRTKRKRHHRKKSAKQLKEEEEIFRGDEEEWELDEGRADLIQKGAQFYNTDMSHRFIWWQTEDMVKSLAEQVQRVQIRRMERDLFETDELVRLLILDRGLHGRGRAGNRGRGGGDGSDSDDGAAVVRSRTGSRAPSRGRNIREVDQIERVVRTAARSPRPPSPVQRRHSDREREANVAARRTGRRRSGTVVEYEVLRPSDGGYVVVDRNYRGDLPRGARVIDEDDLRRPNTGRSSRGRDER
ncbi:uncharacterized protein AB675_10964 [Cyphellophora attinorum]|uniref:Uncharacterized protein n=1 Tax=Cyphellophora attinorum TaxID=1664694 RepID=A0A0N1NY70_9EURO|nr:uncharacterized protein AB675_10964 [Phialophora attinorum]KPI35552.1 hypothetical protein AB675_10964 [Phialophora attinorum]